MKNLRFWTAMLITWLAFIFNIEAMVKQLNDTGYIYASVNIIYSYTYFFVLFIVIFNLLIPNLRKQSLFVFLLIFVLLYLLFTGFFYHESILADIPLTVTQICALILTALLTRQFNLQLHQFEEVINDVTFSYLGGLPDLFSENQGVMYNEVKRARRYQRPISLVALKFGDSSLDKALPQIVTEVQQAMMRQYAVAHIARAIKENTRDFDTIAIYDKTFLAVLPESTSAETALVAEKLHQVVLEKLGIDLEIGIANYPDDAITFEGLVALAINNTNVLPKL
jgi:hypothetical protein